MYKMKFVIKCIMILITMAILNFCFVGDIQSYTRIMMDELYEDDYITLLFLGTSHMYYSFDINKIEEKTNLNAFCAGSARQQMIDSYYLLKEANENNGVKFVFLDVLYTIQQSNKNEEVKTYFITDYMQDGRNKYIYLWDSIGINGFLNDIFPVMHRAYFSLETVKEHFTKAYRNNSYEYVTYKDEGYRGQGFVWSDKTISEGTTFKELAVLDKDELLSDFSLEYLYKIIEYCRENGIELILIDPPIPDATLIAAENFQAYIDEIRKIADENELEYWEFNLIRKGVLSLEAMDFQDEIHLNGMGAEKFTDSFCRMFHGEITNPFYDTFYEKLEYNRDNTSLSY